MKKNIKSKKQNVSPIKTLTKKQKSSVKGGIFDDVVNGIIVDEHGIIIQEQG